MRMPGFTADASLYTSHASYRSSPAGAPVRGEAVAPQLDCETECYLAHGWKVWDSGPLDRCLERCRHVEVEVNPGCMQYISCAPPPAGCHYEGQVLSGRCGTVTCGRLVCPQDEPPPVCEQGDERYEPCLVNGRPGYRLIRCRNGRWQRGSCRAGQIP